jgi:hypothetical protein
MTYYLNRTLAVTMACQCRNWYWVSVARDVNQSIQFPCLSSVAKQPQHQNKITGTQSSSETQRNSYTATHIPVVSGLADYGSSNSTPQRVNKSTERKLIQH